MKVDAICSSATKELLHIKNILSMQNIMMPNFIKEVGDDDLQFQTVAHVDTTSSSRKKCNLPGNPDPEAEVVALSPKTLMATNRYVCEVCHKGFQRDQNLQLHRRGHNLPWKLKQRPATQPRKRVFVCPEAACVHHNPGRALGDLTGIKKHYCRKHGDKKWKCDRCSKRYAVQSDWKAHAKICGTREYRCDCGTVFSRKDSFVTHRAFCDALSEEAYRANRNLAASNGPTLHNQAQELFSSSADHALSQPLSSSSHQLVMTTDFDPFHGTTTLIPNPKAPAIGGLSSPPLALASAYTSATALLQKAAEMDSKTSDTSLSPIFLRGFSTGYFNGSMNFAHKGSSAARISSVSNGMYAPGSDSATGRGKVAGMGLYDLQMEEKMTVDFLGVEPPVFNGRRGYGDEKPEFGSAGQSLQDMHSQW